MEQIGKKPEIKKTQQAESANAAVAPATPTAPIAPSTTIKPAAASINISNPNQSIGTNLQQEIKREAKQEKVQQDEAETPPVENQAETKEKKSALKKEIALFPVSINDKAFLAKHLATILKAGISLPESLRIVQKQAHGKLRNIMSDVISKVEGGKALNIALSDHKNVFDPLFINMVKVGEKSGSLDESLHHLSIQLTKDAKLISKVKSAALYPTIVLITAVLVGGSVSYFILPKLAKLFTSFKANLPLATKILLKISYSLEHFGLWWLGGFLAALLLFYILLKISFIRAIYDWIKLHTPIAGKLIKSLNLARFSLTLGTLLKNGVAIDEALAITRDAITSIPYKKVINSILADVNKGKTVAEGMDIADPRERLFPTTARAMIRVGETTGSLYDSLLYISEFYEEEVDNITKDLSTSLEPILLIFIAFIVAFVAIAIISPMYQILGVIK